MKVKDVIDQLQNVLNSLKEFDPEMEAGIMIDAPHVCCGDSHCYNSGEEVEIFYLNISLDEQYNKSTKKQELKKVWVKG